MLFTCELGFEAAPLPHPPCTPFPLSLTTHTRAHAHAGAAIQGPAVYTHPARPPLVRQHPGGGAEAAGAIPHRDGHQGERLVHRAAQGEEAAAAAAGGPREKA